MKLPQPCFAKDSGRNSGGGSPAGKAAASASDGIATDAAAAPLSGTIDDCPCGVPVTVVSEAGEEVVAIRHQYQPYWFNEDRSGGIAFTPVAWKPL